MNQKIKDNQNIDSSKDNSIPDYDYTTIRIYKKDKEDLMKEEGVNQAEKFRNLIGKD